MSRCVNSRRGQKKSTCELIRGQHSCASEVLQSVLNVLQAPTSLRSTAQTLLLLLGIERHWSTIRMWILEAGLGQLAARSLTMAPDWVWFIDHSVQIGRVQNAW